MFYAMNTEKVLKDIESGEIEFADVSEDQLKYFLSTVAMNCTNEVYEYHAMRKALFSLPRDKQLSVCEGYFLKGLKIPFNDWVIVYW